MIMRGDGLVAWMLMLPADQHVVNGVLQACKNATASQKKKMLYGELLSDSEGEKDKDDDDESDNEDERKKTLKKGVSFKRAQSKNRVSNWDGAQLFRSLQMLLASCPASKACRTFA